MDEWSHSYVYSNYVTLGKANCGVISLSGNCHQQLDRLQHCVILTSDQTIL